MFIDLTILFSQHHSAFYTMYISYLRFFFSTQINSFHFSRKNDNIFVRLERQETADPVIEICCYLEQSLNNNTFSHLSI